MISIRAVRAIQLRSGRADIKSMRNHYDISFRAARLNQLFDVDRFAVRVASHLAGGLDPVGPVVLSTTVPVGVNRSERRVVYPLPVR